jgi:hypothetical protein
MLPPNSRHDLAIFGTITPACQLLHHSGFLTPDDRLALRTAFPSWRLGSIFGHYDFMLLAPVTRRRYSGFGKRTVSRSTSHDVLSVPLAFQYAWVYLDPYSRFCCTKALPLMYMYATYTRFANLHRNQIRSRLLAPRPPAGTGTPGLSSSRTRDMGAAFILFKCQYGDLVRWLGGEYTNAHRNWGLVAQVCNTASSHNVQPGYPPADIHSTMRIFTEGVPLRGHFFSSLQDTKTRIAYDNHQPVLSNIMAVREKFESEEANSFHLSLPRSMAMFIHGLFINPISWVIQKGKGRICIDCSTKLHPTDTGAPNASIPAPGTVGREDENPAVFYGSAIRRHAEHLWNLRISYPKEDILQHSDDINAAFRQILYHPELAPVFACVFMECVLIPVGQIFGSRSAPSWWCQPAECRAHAAAVLDYSSSDTQLADTVQLSEPPTDAELMAFTPAFHDQIHQGILPQYAQRTHHTMFVDDNITAAIRPRMTEAIRSAVGSAYDFFGHPADNRRDPCLKAEKFPTFAGHSIIHLGYHFDSRRMRISWPEDKQTTLHQLVSGMLQERRPQKAIDIARVLGLIRHGAFLCPMGEFLSIRLQWTLNEAVKGAGARRSATSRWWRNQLVRLPSAVLEDMHLLQHCTLPTETTKPSVWSRPIGLVIRRQPTATVLSDASYGGIGGWSSDLGFLWRLKSSDLVTCGFDISIITKLDTKLRTQIEHSLHINILEFVAIVINLWFVLWYIRHQHPLPPGGHVIAVLADNTSALSWMKYAARSHAVPIQHLSLLCQALLTLSNTSDILTTEARHIPGTDNGAADSLSRPEVAPTLASAIKQFPVLQTCHACQVPYALLSCISRMLSSTSIGEQFVLETTSLLTIAPRIFPIGALHTVCQRGFSKRSHRGSSLR